MESFEAQESCRQTEVWLKVDKENIEKKKTKINNDDNEDKTKNTIDKKKTNKHNHLHRHYPFTKT